MLSTIAAYSLGAIASVLALAGGLLALWRLIPRSMPVERITDHEARLTGLEIAFEGFAAQYALTNTQSKAQIGKLRRALARERGEDEEDIPAEQHLAAPQPVPAQPLDLKAELRRRAGIGG